MGGPRKPLNIIVPRFLRGGPSRGPPMMPREDGYNKRKRLYLIPLQVNDFENTFVLESFSSLNNKFSFRQMAKEYSAGFKHSPRESFS